MPFLDHDRGVHSTKFPGGGPAAGGWRNGAPVASSGLMILNTQIQIALSVDKKHIWIRILNRKPWLSRWGDKNIVRLVKLSCTWILPKRSSTLKFSCREIFLFYSKQVPVWKICSNQKKNSRQWNTLCIRKIFLFFTQSPSVMTSAWHECFYLVQRSCCVCRLHEILASLAWTANVRFAYQQVT